MVHSTVSHGGQWHKERDMGVGTWVGRVQAALDFEMWYILLFVAEKCISLSSYLEVGKMKLDHCLAPPPENILPTFMQRDRRTEHWQQVNEAGKSTVAIVWKGYATQSTIDFNWSRDKLRRFKSHDEDGFFTI